MADENRVRTGWIFIYLTACVLVWLMAARLFVSEANVIQGFSMDFVSVTEEFKIKTLGSGKGIDLIPLTGDGEYTIEKTGGQNGFLLEITCRLPENEIGKRQSFVLISEADHELDKWKYMGNTPPVNAASDSFTETNIYRYLYLVLAFLFTAVFFPVRLIGKRCPDVYMEMNRIWNKMRESEEGRKAWEAGKRQFIFSDRVLEGCISTVFFIVIVFGFQVFRDSYRTASYYQDRLLGDWMAFFLTAAFFLMIGLAVEMFFWQASLIELLGKKSCPLSAGVASGLTGMYGGFIKRGRDIHILNAATAFCRAGWFEEALVLERLLPEGYHYGSQPLISLARANLLVICQRELGLKEEMEHNLVRYQIILEENPKMRGHNDIIRLGLVNKLRISADEQRAERAEAFWEQLKDMCPDAYCLLPSALCMVRLYEKTENFEKAAPIIRWILRQSPENREVKEMLTYGECTYIEKTPVSHNRVCKYMIGVKLVFAVILFLSLYLRGTDIRVYGVEIEETQEITTAYEETRKSAEPESQIQSQALEVFPSFTIEYPESWNGLYVEEKLEGGGIAVYQKSSRERMGDGFLFAVTAEDNGEYVNLPGYEILGYVKEYVYILTLPTDVSFYLEDAAVEEEYNKMSREIARIKETFRIDSQSARYGGEDFIFPNSGYMYLTESDLLNLSGEKLKIAKNEIYARCGRQLRDEELKSYFHGKDWYRGTVEPDDFTDDMLNEYELANVMLIQGVQNRYLTE